MFISVQRVRSVHGTTGVNGVVHRHGQAMRAEDWVDDPLSVLARARDRRLKGSAVSMITVPPGGNSVESSLDLACPDETPLAMVEALFLSLRDSRERHVVLSVGAIVGELSVNTPSAGVSSSLEELADRVRTLLNRSPSSVLHEPITILQSHDEDGWLYELSPDSAERVRNAGGEPSRVRVSFDVADDFRKIHGKLHPHVAEWVTNLSRDSILSLGGARIIDGGQVMSEWTPRSW